MKRVAVLLLGALALVACSKDHPPDKTGSATLTGGSVNSKQPPTPEEIRMVLMQGNPNDPQVAALVITDDDGVVTIRGAVPDEQTREDVVNRTKNMPNVTTVRDELQVHASQPQGAAGAPGMGGPPDGAAGAPAPGAGKATPATDAVRASMKRDDPKAMSVIEQLIIMDDGSAIYIRGIVPDAATHDALLKSAQSSAGGRHVADDMHVSGSNNK